MELDLLVDEYFNELINDDSFKELLELKKIINEKYQKLIVSFKTNESIYNEAKEKNYLTNEIRDNFMNSKINLYSKEEVKRYFELERIINLKLKNDFNEIKENISNKLTKDDWLF